MNKERVEEKAKLWCQIVHTSANNVNDRQKHFERKGVLGKLDKYGLGNEKEANYFLRVLNDHGINISFVASDIADLAINLSLPPLVRVDVKRKIHCGSVQLVGYGNELLDGIFVLGVSLSDSSRNFTLVAREGIGEGHFALARNYALVDNFTIIEGGFSKVSHYSKTIILHGRTKSYRVGYGSFTFSMLREAFPDYQIVIR